ncbi:hypothetical protein KIL84_022747 [Mauremys mutica]|uniref:Uncharacterized protein n=1 Tax=Mauremys mutica TaxID=74926 RepID=A0A9D3WPY4_9SAUR|nr:hypothetical protein KIL84_022747 [Mauremys mutica]
MLIQEPFSYREPGWACGMESSWTKGVWGQDCRRACSRATLRGLGGKLPLRFASISCHLSRPLSITAELICYLLHPPHWASPCARRLCLGRTVSSSLCRWYVAGNKEVKRHGALPCSPSVTWRRAACCALLETDPGRTGLPVSLDPLLVLALQGHAARSSSCIVVAWPQFLPLPVPPNPLSPPVERTGNALGEGDFEYPAGAQWLVPRGTSPGEAAVLAGCSPSGGVREGTGQAL